MDLRQATLSEDARFLLDSMRKGKRILFSGVRGIAFRHGHEGERECTVALSELLEAKLIRVAKIEKAVAWVWYEAVPEGEIK